MGAELPEAGVTYYDVPAEYHAPGYRYTYVIPIRSEGTLEAPKRREKFTAEIVMRTGITEDLIERLVRGFYAKIRRDAVLAPIFEARITIGSLTCNACALSGRPSL